ncbi:MAG: AAA family ATPase [Acidobacteria bacterium]|nr:AAA family ATPase [Acidobacteriota bacterium]
MSLFAELNNLTDITVDARYGALCGYREDDLDTVFAPEPEGLDRERMRDCDDGHSWSGPDRVYDPYALLRLFDSHRFSAHWFESGTPTFPVETLVRRGVSSESGPEGDSAQGALLAGARGQFVNDLVGSMGEHRQVREVVQAEAAGAAPAVVGAVEAP